MAKKETVVFSYEPKMQEVLDAQNASDLGTAFLTDVDYGHNRGSIERGEVIPNIFPNEGSMVHGRLYLTKDLGEFAKAMEIGHHMSSANLYVHKVDGSRILMPLGIDSELPTDEEGRSEVIYVASKDHTNKEGRYLVAPRSHLWAYNAPLSVESVEAIRDFHALDLDSASDYRDELENLLRLPREVKKGEMYYAQKTGSSIRTNEGLPDALTVQVPAGIRRELGLETGDFVQVSYDGGKPVTLYVSDLNGLKLSLSDKAQFDRDSVVFFGRKAYDAMGMPESEKKKGSRDNDLGVTIQKIITPENATVESLNYNPVISIPEPVETPIEIRQEAPAQRDLDTEIIRKDDLPEDLTSDAARELGEELNDAPAAYETAVEPEMESALGPAELTGLFDGLERRLSGKIAEVKEHVDELHQSYGGFEELTNQRLGAIPEKIDQSKRELYKEVQQITSQLSIQTQAVVAEVQTQVEGLYSRLEKLEQQVAQSEEPELTSDDVASILVPGGESEESYSEDVEYAKSQLTQTGENPAESADPYAMPPEEEEKESARLTTQTSGLEAAVGDEPAHETQEIQVDYAATPEAEPARAETLTTPSYETAEELAEGVQQQLDAEYGPTQQPAAEESTEAPSESLEWLAQGTQPGSETQEVEQPYQAPSQPAADETGTVEGLEQAVQNAEPSEAEQILQRANNQPLDLSSQVVPQAQQESSWKTAYTSLGTAAVAFGTGILNGLEWTGDRIIDGVMYLPRKLGPQDVKVDHCYDTEAALLGEDFNGTVGLGPEYMKALKVEDGDEVVLTSGNTSIKRKVRKAPGNLIDGTERAASPKEILMLSKDDRKLVGFGGEEGEAADEQMSSARESLAHWKEIFPGQVTIKKAPQEE